MKLLSKKEIKQKFNLLRAKKIQPSNLECSLEYNRSPEEEHMQWGAFVLKNKDVIFPGQ